MSERLEIRTGAEVLGAEGNIGRVGRVIVSPVSREVTALEVTRPLRPSVVLPIEAVRGANPDTVQTDLTAAGVDTLPVCGDDAFCAPPGDWRSPTGHAAEHVLLRLPRRPDLDRLEPARAGRLDATAGGMPVRAGQEVVGLDGRIGSLREVLLDSASRRVTHFVMQPQPMDEREVIVPVEWIDGVTRDRITLHVGEEQLDRLPVYRSDEQITDAVLDVLWYRSDLSAEDLRHVDIRTRDGIVELSGYTRTDGASSAIEAVVRGLDGVLGVRNRLTSFETLARASSQAGEWRPEQSPP
jgi:osmotically-inducible protein OsmY